MTTPPLPQSSGWFLPYMYVPSEDATYIKLVAPLGSIHVDSSLKNNLLQVAIALVVIGISWWGWRRNRKRSSSSSTSSKSSSNSTKATSALGENIELKGVNSYYYAHQRRVGSEDSGDELKKTMVSSYSWADAKKAVTIFLTDDVVTTMKEEQLQLSWTATSLSMNLLIDADNKIAKSLVISTLYDEITDVTWKIKRNQILLTLHKKKAAPWMSLNGAAKNLEEHIEYDESLYE